MNDMQLEKKTKYDNKNSLDKNNSIIFQALLL